MTAREVEIGVADKFNYRQNVIVPNVSWGIGLRYEADLVVLRPSGYAVEVEIKVNASDIKADLKKRHQHDSKLFRELWFAVPEELADCLSMEICSSSSGSGAQNGWNAFWSPVTGRGFVRATKCRRFRNCRSSYLHMRTCWNASTRRSFAPCETQCATRPFSATARNTTEGCGSVSSNH